MGRHERTARALASVRRRGVTLCGLAMIVAGLIWAAIAWATTADFRLKKPSGQYIEVTVDTESSHYKRFIYKGQPKYGRSLFSVLEEAKIDEWTSVTVEGLTVRAGEFSRSKPPLFIVRGEDELTFYRPKTEGSSDESRPGIGVMTYRVPLKVDADPGGTPEAGDTVTYTAEVPEGGPQNAYEFTWTPSSGTGGTGQRFEYTYPKSAGEVTINVTAKRASDDMTVGTATAATHDIEYTPPPSNSGSGGFGGTGGTSYDYSAPPSSDYDYDYNFPDSGSTTEIPETKTPKVPETEETTPLEDFGTSVEGELLSTVAPLPPASGDSSAVPPEEEAASDPEEAIEEAEEISAPGALIAGGIVVGLLGLGAGREMENVRPRRIRRPDLSGLRRLSPPWK